MSESNSNNLVPLSRRLANNPRPAIIWLAGMVLLVGVEFGALAQVVLSILGGIASTIPGDPLVASINAASGIADSIPTLLSRELIPNQGWQTSANGPWEGTFLGLEPMWAWLIRVVLVYVYAFVFLGWLWFGFTTYRRYYRHADWTPTDDMVRRFRSHWWGIFGFLVIFMFLVMAIFAPTLGPTTIEQNILRPYSHEVKYFNEDVGDVSTVPVGVANLQSQSKGNPGTNVGPLSYDDYGRFHPFGTLVSGKDLFTFMAYGARISLFIGLAAVGISGFMGLLNAMISAYYKGAVDLLFVVTSDSVQAIPILMMLILVVSVFQNTWLAGIYDGALLLITILGLVYWPYMWRAVRGPALQVAEEEWIDAAKSFGQKPRVIMRKHMAPYIIGYMLIYGSLSLGGVIIAVAGLSFLGLGINPPTPEWGRAVNAGQPYVASVSWHISLIPGLLITLVVTGFNALGDGIRDAIDPQSEAAESGGAGAAAGGGGA